MDFFHNSVLLNCSTQALLLQGIAIFLLQWKYVGISMICYFVCVKRSLPMHTFIRNGNHDFRKLLIAKINLINDRTIILMNRNRVWVCLLWLTIALYCDWSRNLLWKPNPPICYATFDLNGVKTCAWVFRTSVTDANHFHPNLNIRMPRSLS